MDDLLKILSSGQLLSLYSVLVVVCLEKRLSIPDKIHPLTFFQLLAKRMAYKVNKQQPGNKLQQSIAGTLAPLVLLTPLIVIIAMLLYLAEFPLFFDTLLLFVALRFQPIITHSKKIALAIKHNKNTLAKHQLQDMVLRETAKLSPFGLTKACIETMLLRFSHQYCAVLLLYLVGGGLLAISYSLLLVLSQSWSPRLTAYVYFGRPAGFVVNILQWLPARISACCLILSQGPLRGWQAILSKNLFQPSRFVILDAAGRALNIELGGPLYYNQQKLRLAKCGGDSKVKLNDINRTITAIQQTQWLFLALYIVVVLALSTGA